MQRFNYYYMYFSRLFYFHLISCWSILKHLLSPNTKANTLQCSFSIPSELISCQASFSQAMLSIIRSSSLLSEGACDPCVCWTLRCHAGTFCPPFWGWPSSHSVAFWAGTAEDMAGQSGEDQHHEIFVCYELMRVTLHCAVPNMTTWHFI